MNRFREAEAEIRVLREDAEKRPETQCETAVGESGLDEEGKVDIDEEVDSKKKLDQRKKE